MNGVLVWESNNLRIPLPTINTQPLTWALKATRGRVAAAVFSGNHAALNSRVERENGEGCEYTALAWYSKPHYAGSANFNRCIPPGKLDSRDIVESDRCGEFTLEAGTRNPASTPSPPHHHNYTAFGTERHSGRLN